VGRDAGRMRLPRSIELEPDARLALGQIIGIMSDQAMSGDGARWDLERLIELETRLGLLDGMLADDSSATVTIGIDDAALLLDGLAFTEIASADFAWIEMVRWTADFVTAELRQFWTDDEWLQLAAETR
jgi:hypothetical protein